MTKLRRLAVVSFLASVAAISFATPASAYVRTDVVDENYLTGYLFVKDGKAGISWQSHAASDDNVDLGNNSEGLWNEFRSQPLPQSVFLNASRVIQLDLFFQSSIGLRVELRAGSSFLTGGQLCSGCEGNSDIYYCRPDQKADVDHCAEPSLRPSAPGYYAATLRMLTELDTLERGSVVSLRVVHESSGQATYGLAEGHASVLRIPVFSSDDVLYRVPKYSHENQARGPSPVPELDPVSKLLSQVLHPSALGVGPLLLGGAAAPRRRQRRAILLFVLFFASSLAGCAAPHGQSGPPISDPGLGGTGRADIVSDPMNETGLADERHGALFGVVLDAEALPVNGAFVGTIGRPFSTRTDPYGRFQFRDLEPGTYHLRIDRVGFLPFEGAYSVVAASITKIEIQLEYSSAKEATQRPHRHNHWFGADGNPADTIVLMDQWLEFKHPQGFLFVPLPPPAIVLPGTRDVEINLTWEGGTMGFVVPSLGDRNPGVYFNGTALYPRASGTPFHLRTTWEMTDPGHATYSYWPGFMVHVDSFGCDQSIPGGNPAMCRGPHGSVENNDFELDQGGGRAHMRIVLHRGVVPLEPAHPDRWGSDDSISILPEQSQTLVSYCGKNCPLKVLSSDSSGTSVSVIGLHSGTTSRPFNSTWQPKGFVPFETKWLDVRLQVNRHQVPQDSSAAPWRLFYRPAATTNYGNCDPFARQLNTIGVTCFNHEASKTLAPSAEDPAGLTWTWRVPLAPGEPDPAYARYTNWCFYVAPSDPNAQILDDYANGGDAANRPVLTLSVTGHRDPMPKF